MACREQGPFPVNPVGCFWEQERQDEKLLQGKRTGSMIGCVFEVIHELGSGFLGIPVEASAMVELKTVKSLAK